MNNALDMLSPLEKHDVQDATDRIIRDEVQGLRASYLRDALERRGFCKEEYVNAQTGYLKMNIHGKSVEVMTRGPDAGVWFEAKD